jgi:thiol-disulfide isomerase/thioredoxin
MKYLLPVFLIVLAVGCNSRTGKSAVVDEAMEEKYKFPMISIPSTILSPEERAVYLVRHYWDNFTFSDTAFFVHKDVVEQALVDYIDLFPYTSMETVAGSVNDMIRKCGENADVFSFFANLFDKYLYDPYSSMRNDEYFIPVLEAMLSSGALKERTRAEMLLVLVKKNRVGNMATDFVYTLANGQSGRMRDLKGKHVLLYFFNPDCENCQAVTKSLRESTVVNTALADKTLTILAMYTEKDIEAWKRHLPDMPKGWVVGYDKSGAIDTEQLYDLKAMPTLYLLNAGKEVVLKDAPFEQVEDYLR